MASGSYKVPQTQMLVEAVTSQEFTIAGSSFTSNGLSVSVTKTGYTPIGLVGLDFTGNNTTLCFAYRWHINASDKKAYVYVRNTSSSSAYLTFKAYVLYQKD